MDTDYTTSQPQPQSLVGDWEGIGKLGEHRD